MNEALQTLEIKVENNGTTPQGKIFAREWNVLVEAVKALDLKEFDEAKLLQYLRDNDFITSEDIPDVDFSNVVTLSGQQTISGAKDFVGGIKVNGMPITYNVELGVWEFTGDLFVTGNFAWGSSIDGFKPSTVMDAVRVDGSTIIKKKDSNGDWYLYAPGGGSGGSDGGLTLGDVVSYLRDNDYTTKTDVNSLITSSLAGYATEQWVANKGYLTSSALAGYATEQWVANKGYLTSSALVGYATQSWVGDNYLAKSGGTITGASGALTIARRDADQIGILFTGASGDLGLIGFSSSDTPAYIKYDGNAYPILHSGNYTDYFTKSNIKSTLGISDWALAETKPTYTAAEVGAYTGNGSSIPNGEDLANLQAGSYWVHENLGAASAAKLSYSSLVVLGNSYYSPQMNISHNAQQAYIRGVYNKGTGNSVSDWHELAFTDSNVASATKLQTPRTIWGQSFDGTGNISGLLTNVDGIRGSTTNGGYIGDRNKGLGATDGGSMIYNYSSSPITFHIAGSEYMRIANGGNVAIGGTTADAKLHVHGTTILGGDTTINGNLLVNGNVSWFSHSQRSLKNIISEQGLSLAQLERIKPIKFYWKDGRDMALHVGGVADVFAEVLPEVVTRNLQDILCLNYVDAAFYVGASLIAPVLDHERRITRGEAEQEALKKENAKLKRELEEVKSKLNQLVA